jgi:hypothetical protein
MNFFVSSLNILSIIHFLTHSSIDIHVMILLFFLLFGHLNDLASVFLDCLLDLSNEFLEELDLLFHGAQVRTVTLKFKLASTLSYLHFLSLLGQLLLHVIHFATIYLLDLLILILDYGDVLLLSAGLHAELLSVLLCALFVLILDFLLLGLGLTGDLSDLVAQSCILLPHRLGLLLKTSLLSLILSHEFNVIAHDLVIEDLLLL